MKVLLIVIVFIHFSAADIMGVDISSLISVGMLKCIKKEGYDFVIPRCYHSFGAPDTSCPQTIRNALEAGYKPDMIAGYMFPCPKCEHKNGTFQVKELMSFLKNQKISLKRIYLDIEGYPKYWSNNTAENQMFFKELVLAFVAENQPIGVYAGHREWGYIMGTDFDFGSEYTQFLWYAHYDDKKSFYDYVPHGGWSKPTMKQILGSQPLCGGKAKAFDINWNPHGEI